MSEQLTYELLKANNNWTLGSNNSVLSIISKDASFNNLLIENGLLTNSKSLNQILLEDNSNNKLLNLKQIDDLIKNNNITDNNNILDLQNLVNELSNNLVITNNEINNNNESIINNERSISDLSNIVTNNSQAINDLLNNLTVNSELTVIGGSSLASVSATSLSVTGSTDLTTLVANDVSFSNLDVSVNLNVTNDLTVDGTTTLDIANLSSLLVTGVTDLNTLSCDDASFANVDISVNLRIDGELRMQNGINYVGFNVHSDTSQNQIWNLPTSDGTEGQVIKTDGAGNLSWDNLVSGPAGDNRTLQFNDNGTLAGSSGLKYTSNGQLLLDGNTTNDTLFKIIRSSGTNDIMQILDSGASDTSIIKITQNGDLVVDAGKLVIGTSTIPTSESLLVDGNMKVDNGNIVITNTSNYISLPQRGVTAPSLLFESDTNCGLSQGFADTLSLVTNGNERYRVGANGELLIGGTSAGSANQVLTSQGSSSAPTWSNVTDLVLEQDVSLSNIDISQVLNVSETINLNNSNTFINVLESDNSSNQVLNTQQNMGMLNEYIGEKTKALLFMNNISTLATTHYEIICDTTTTNNNGVNNFVVDTSYISFVDISNYGDCLLEIYCHCDANTGSSSADNYIIFDLSAIEPVTNNTLSIVDIDTRSVSKGLTLHMAFGNTCYKLMNTTNGSDFTKSIDFNNKYIMRVYTGVDYDLTELKLCLKITKLNYI